MGKKFYISKQDLEKLLKDASAKEVADKLGCSRATIDNWRKKYGIPPKKKCRWSFDEVKSCFEEHGCELLETEYLHNHHPMKYRCVCGNVSRISLLHFRNGKRCKECKRRKFLGPNNHKWNPNRTNEERIKERKYPEYKEWLQAIIKRDEFTCQVCNKKGGDLNAHHLYGYNLFPSKRLEIDNGVTLCEKCHKKFHGFYGYGDNTREQFINAFLFNLNQISEFGFVNATEECARQVYEHLGCGDPKELDRIATTAIRNKLNEIEFSGRVILCEGQKDESHGLYNERVGTLEIPVLDLDIACDPIDGSTRSSNLQSDASSILVLATKGALFVPNTHYMKKLVMHNEIYEAFKRQNVMELPVADIAKKLVGLLRRPPIISLLKRDRNQQFAEDFRKEGCKIRFIQDCDVFESLRVFKNEIDLYYGIGGAPETILAASAVNAFGGRIEAQCVESDTWLCKDIMGNNQLINGYSVFVATGITDGSMLNGVKRKDDKMITHTMFTSDGEKGVVRYVTTEWKGYHEN